MTVLSGISREDRVTNTKLEETAQNIYICIYIYIKYAVRKSVYMYIYTRVHNQREVYWLTERGGISDELCLKPVQSVSAPDSIPITGIVFRVIDITSSNSQTDCAEDCVEAISCLV